MFACPTEYSILDHDRKRVFVIEGYMRLICYNCLLEKRNPILAAYSRGVYVSADVDAAYREVKWFEDSYHDMPIPEDTIRRWTIFGRPDECIKQMQPFVDAGVEVFVICVRARDFFSQVRTIAKEILPAFA